MRFSVPLKRIDMKPFGCHPAIRTSGAARAFYFIQGSSWAKQMLTWYRSLIFRASLPKEMKTQSQLLKAVCICPVRFLSPKNPKNPWLDVFLYSPRKEPRAIWFHPFFIGRIVICVFHGRSNESVWNQPSVLQEPRALYFIQGSSLTKQILTWYRSLIFRAGLPKKTKNQSQLLKAVCICPVRFLSLTKCMARCSLAKSTRGVARYLVSSVL